MDENIASRALDVLIGLKLSVTHHAGNMRGFHFGRLTYSGKRVCGEYALHVQCPWRIERESSILTGFHDWYVFTGRGIEPESWEPATGGSLQELRLRELFDCPVKKSRAIVNQTESLIVTEVASDPYGGCRIVLDGAIALVLFPCSSDGEHWRLFQPDSSVEHFVVGCDPFISLG